MSGEGRVALGIGLAQRVDPVAGFAEVVHQIHDGVEDRELELIQRNWKQKCAQSWVAKRVKRHKQKQHVLSRHRYLSKQILWIFHIKM